MAPEEPSNAVLLEKIYALGAQVERNRQDVKEDLEQMRESFDGTVKDLIAGFKEQVDNLSGSFRAEGGTWRTEHVKAEDQRWAAHTGDNGDHEHLEEGLAKQRSEDINRMYTLLGIIALIFAAVIGIVGARVEWRPGMVLVPGLGVTGLFVAVGSLFRWPRFLFGRR